MSSTIMAQPDVDGCLVGGASLKAEEFRQGYVHLLQKA
jgi:triosephosphate isomerase